MRIAQTSYLISAPTVAGCPPPDRPEICFAGRSNVGKSSLINALTQRKSLAKTSSTPGKTRMLNYFDVDGRWYLVDLPGFGYAKVPETERRRWDVEMTRYFTTRPNLRLIVHLVDARHEPTALDRTFWDRLLEHSLPFVVLLTKADRISGTLAGKRKTDAADLLRTLGVDGPVLLTSAAANTGLDEARALIGRYLQPHLPHSNRPPHDI
jgi:GTP-binding protein